MTTFLHKPYFTSVHEGGGPRGPKIPKIVVYGWHPNETNLYQSQKLENKIAFIEMGYQYQNMLGKSS